MEIMLNLTGEEKNATLRGEVITVHHAIMQKY